MAANGISGWVEGASFLVECLPNEASWTTQTLQPSKKQETSGEEPNIDINTGVVENEHIAYMTVVTPRHIYQAELRYDQSLIREICITASI